MESRCLLKAAVSATALLPLLLAAFQAGSGDSQEATHPVRAPGGGRGRGPALEGGAPGAADVRGVGARAAEMMMRDFVKRVFQDTWGPIEGTYCTILVITHHRQS